MGFGVIYDPDNGDKELMNSVHNQLVSWVMAHVTEWEDHRDNNYEERWNEYYRIWRGVWMEKDKSRDSERSRLISPATSQAIEVAASEIEEAIFGKGKWFDIADDVEDLEKKDLELFRNKLIEDLDECGFPRSFAEVILNGCIYGTGIAKISVEEQENYEFGVGSVDNYVEVAPQAVSKIKLRLTAIEPREFCIDPAARTVDEALGCAQTILVPRHQVVFKIQSGEYRTVKLGNYNDTFDYYEKGETRTGMEDQVKVTEYHGLVPLKLLNFDEDDPNDEESDHILEGVSDSSSFDEEEELVEAIITIANDTELLKAVENPYIMKDRCFVAYQHDTVPNRFWGRGVAEKGYNPQKALDAELRGRIDAMSLAIHPMMAVDATMIPRGGDLSVRAGKTILTNGDPRQALFPMNFGQVGTNTFQESGDLERMIQMATGSMDSAVPVGSAPRNNTLGGMSIMQSAAIKRSKRTLANIEATFTKPLIKKAAWRYMQFDPESYPPTDPKFIVNGTLGIMARELEMQQLSSLLSTTQGNTVGYWMLMSSIYEHTSVSNREQMIATSEQQLQLAMNPQPDPAVQQKQQEMEYKQQYDMAKLQIEQSRADTERMRVQAEIAQLEEKVRNLKVESDFTETKSESTRRTTIVETEQAIKAQENKLRELDQRDKEIALKAKDMDVKITLSQNEILAAHDDKQMELALQGKTVGSSKAPVINIHSARSKKLTVTRTKDGWEGISEPVGEYVKEGLDEEGNVNVSTAQKRRISVKKTDSGMEGTSEAMED